ncbi:MAG: glycosyltransferase family 4 protein [Planctomycetota bacterium]
MNPTLTVLHLCSIKGRGGTGYMAGRLCRLLADQGVSVIVGACQGSKMAARAHKAGLPLLEGLRLERGFHPAALWKDASRVRACIRAEGVDLVHTWHSIETWTAALALVGLKAGLVRTRGLVTPVRRSLANRILHGRTALVHVTCRRIAEHYRAAGLDLDRVRLVPDGVDTARFRPGLVGSAVRAEAGIPPGAPVAVSVGRLEPVKGHRYLLEATALLSRTHPDLCLVAAGDGTLREELKAQAAALGIADRVRFLGVRRDIPAVLAAGDVYVLPSVGSEGSSRATLEAMAMAKPVVASAVGMLPDIVREGETGFLVPPGSPEALAERLGRLLDNPEARLAFGRRARAWVEEEFDERLFARRIRKLYEEVAP